MEAENLKAFLLLRHFEFKTTCHLLVKVRQTGGWPLQSSEG